MVASQNPTRGGILLTISRPPPSPAIEGTRTEASFSKKLHPRSSEARFLKHVVSEAIPPLLRVLILTIATYIAAAFGKRSNGSRPNHNLREPERHCSRGSEAKAKGVQKHVRSEAVNRIAGV